MVVTRPRAANAGTHQTRRELRTRNEQSRLRKSLSAVPRRSVFTVLGLLIGVVEVVGRGARRSLLGGLIILLALLLFSAEKAKQLLAPVSQEAVACARRVAEKGLERDRLLFVGLLGSGLSAISYMAVGKASLGALCGLLAIFMGIGLWLGEKRGDGTE